MLGWSWWGVATGSSCCLSLGRWDHSSPSRPVFCVAGSHCTPDLAQASGRSQLQGVWQWSARVLALCAQPGVSSMTLSPASLSVQPREGSALSSLALGGDNECEIAENPQICCKQWKYYERIGENLPGWTGAAHQCACSVSC